MEENMLTTTNSKYEVRNLENSLFDKYDDAKLIADSHVKVYFFMKIQFFE